jgi:KamA family protein
MAHWEATLSYIQNHTEVEEVILSGGDPLSLGNNKLFELLKRIEQVPHVRRLRIHTRFPVMIPSRIDDGFLQAVKELHKPVWMVLHINHPNEIDLALSNALTALRKSGVVLLNQAVLLKGINDSIETQRALCNRLVNEGVQPYYLHQLDRVEGTAHFESDERLGVAIIEQLRSEISGYAVPEFVREIAGQPSKTPIR